MTSDQHPAIAWRISSRSSSGSGNCVEAGPYLDGTHRYAVRNSRYRTDPMLTIGTAAWQSFVDGVRTDRYDGPQ